MTDTDDFEQSNIAAHARRELALLRSPSDEPDEMQDAIEAHIMAMLRTFYGEGHSGSSAAYTIGCLEKLLRFELITPLTGADDEWVEVSDGVFQNSRCGRVFKGDCSSGQAYDIEGKVFREPDGTCFTGRDSRVYVTFPYRPKTEYVDVPASESL